jgi:hypothetical protein
MRTLDLRSSVVIFPTPIAVPSHSSYMEHRPHAVRLPLRYERALPLVTGNCDPTYVLYTTVVLTDPPLFTREGGLKTGILVP